MRRLAFIFAVYVLFLLVITAFAWTIFNWSEIRGYIRYDKYPIYMDWCRFLTLLIVFSWCAYIFHKFVLPLRSGVLLPANLFLGLFSLLVLPGVLLTSDFEQIGHISFYGYLAALFCFVSGLVIISVLMKFSAKHEIKAYQELGVASYRNVEVTYLIMLCMLVSASIIAYFSTEPGQGVFRLAVEFIRYGDLPEGAREVADKRIGAYSDAGYRSVVSVISAYSTGLLLPLGSAFVLLNGIVRNNHWEKCIGVFLVVTVLFILISSGSRLRGLFFLLFVFTLLSHIKPLRVTSISFWAISIGGLLTIQTIVLGRMVGGGGYLGNLVMSFNRVIERVFLVKGYVTQQVFHYIPDVSDYKGGETYSELLGVNADGFTFAEEMSHFIYGPAGTAGPQAFAEGYANFGMVGMILVALVMGMAIQAVTILIVRQQRKDVLKLVFQAFIIVLVARTGYGSLLTFKSNGMHILLILWGVVWLLRKGVNICVNGKGRMNAP